MKKTIKATVAMLLAFIIACGSLTAFAADTDVIKWDIWNDDEPIDFDYAGEIAVGADAMEISFAEGNNFVYCTFTAEEDGFYKITSSCYCTDWMGVAEKFEDGVYRSTENCIFDGNEQRENYYYLEAGEHVLGFWFYNEGSEEVSIEYVGEIVDVEFDEESFKNLVLGGSIYDDYADASCYYVCADLTVKFENGLDLYCAYMDVCVYPDEKLGSGEYEVELGIYGFDYRESAVINVTDLADVIEKIELTNIEKYKELIYFYDYETGLKNVENETLTITYKDGTTEVYDDFYNYVYIEKYDVYAECYYDLDEDYIFCISVANNVFVRETCSVRKATNEENVNKYNDRNTNRISYTFEWMGMYLNDIFYSRSFSDAVVNIKYFFSESAVDWLYTFSYLMSNTAELISYIF